VEWTAQNAYIPASTGHISTHYVNKQHAQVIKTYINYQGDQTDGLY